MSGFLERLVQRTVTNLPRVRPRPVTAFESLPPQAARDALEATTLETEKGSNDGDGVGRGARSIPSPPMVSHDEIRRLPRNPGSDRHGPRTHEETAHRSSTWMNPHGDPAPAEPWKSPVPQPRSDTRPAALRTGSDAGDVAAYAAAESAATFVEQEMPAPFVELLRRRQKLSWETVEVADTYPPAKRVPEASPLRQAAEPDAVTAIEAPPTPHIHEQGRSVSSPPRLADAQSEVLAAILTPRLPQLNPIAQPLKQPTAKSEEPAIHVTIGRVEIRAVSAPSAQKRSVAPKPALGLGEYLERRRGGHR